ncbi:copper chaperone CopZ [Caproiciproducens faecalis]|uniref:Copper chaperone CopZ n=1 Tax=Caproiciproducens faecalis TaxID=2820301 RepID=A0ABS7DL67_9FIRM|nr:copper chaperone CopZ [Caproiciproducens faecalis]MBW7572044.1 copper chaperone CopZ [Caproiciproducens faecalis]
MEKILFNVNGMSCEHCVRSITKAVSALSGIGGVSVSLDAKTVEVEYDPAKSSPDQIKSEIEDQGYDVV